MARFVCCGITFEGEQSYIEHRQQIHGERPGVKCTCCGIDFYTDEAYSEHRLAIHGEGEPEGSPTIESSSAGGQQVGAGPLTTEPVYLPLCKVCRTPIRGLRALPYRLRGITPFSKNPQLCNR